MSKKEQIKEEIGWLKIAFTLLVAIDVSMIGWAAQNFAGVSLLFLSCIIGAVIVVTAAIIFVNRFAYKKFNELGDL